jgi:flagellar P-ring protein precursor FlgI
MFSLLLLVLMFPVESHGARLKDLASWEGVRDNQLIGYGLVVGLAGTGDKRQTVFSAQSLTNMLEKMGVTVNPTAIQVKNTAAVMITGTLPPYGQPGTRLDVHVAAVGDASNLQGGMLLLTPLKGADGQTFAVAQGPVVTGGFVSGRGGSSQTVNHPTAGRVPNGAIIEKAAPSQAPSSSLRLQLRVPDFTTAARVAEVINRKYSLGGPAVARPLNAAVIQIESPAKYSTRTVQFVAEIENLSVEADRETKIVINERTGTIVLGKEVKISPVAILHGALNVEIQTSYDVSQPAPLSTGTTTVTPQVGVSTKEEKAKNILLKNGATVEDLVKALMAIGSTPRDVIAILQNLKSAGALEAMLEVI